ncbi:MAG: hypothetical protein E2O99_03950 [Acidobacteria bacterium]|nr:MAG: hypothetical protein E2O99_03950 [Acidobacteriota bacterium]
MLRAAAVVVSGFLIATLMVMGVSRVLFTNPTSNDANAFTSGNVVLVNEDALTDGVPPLFDETGSALFTFTAMAPGDTSTVCFEVIYEGNLDADIVLATVIISGVNENSIGDELNLTVDRYTDSGCSAGIAAVASGTLSTPGITETVWQPAVPGTDESRWYETTVTLDSAAPNTVQDSSATGVEFEWLATNN